MVLSLSWWYWSPSVPRQRSHWPCIEHQRPSPGSKPSKVLCTLHLHKELESSCVGQFRFWAHTSFPRKSWLSATLSIGTEISLCVHSHERAPRLRLFELPYRGPQGRL